MTTMTSNISKTVAAAVSTGLMMGALAACGNNKPDAASPAAGADETGAAAGAKDCCKGKNECKGQGGCAVAGGNSCSGQNFCKGQGGCSGKCPK